MATTRLEDRATSIADAAEDSIKEIERKRAKPRTSVQVAEDKFEKAKLKLDIATAYATCKSAPRILETSIREAIAAGSREQALLALSHFNASYERLINLELPDGEADDKAQSADTDEDGEQD